MGNSEHLGTDTENNNILRNIVQNYTHWLP